MSDRVVIAPEAPDGASLRAIVDRARQRGFRRFLLPESASVPSLPGEEIAVRTSSGIRVGTASEPVTPIVSISDPATLEARVEGTADGATLIVEWTGDRVIPLENAVARRGGRFRLWTIAGSPDQVPASLGALEHGADRVVVPVRSPDEVDRLESLLERVTAGDLAWRKVTLTAIRPAGLGDRVLVDTTSILRPDEGLLVGSAAALLFHVASEAVGSEFSRPRPFRVNAGAAHSYVLMADGTTRYLSELEGGDSVLVAVPHGAARAVRVGRIKIERRPMVVLTADDDHRARTIFLQEAETVRVSTDAGRIAVTALRPGRLLDAVRLPTARHLGTAVEETIEER
ncbi:MAG TPA: 3-dehydroquinate synthase II [Thermoplasmata archaeon]|nr:3-dehydroquinate synthase II [Thermoplasmata archaeon]